MAHITQSIANLIGPSPKLFSENVDVLYHQPTEAKYDLDLKAWFGSAGSTINFKSYVNSLYSQNIWPLNSKVKEVSLFLRGQGNCTVRLIELSRYDETTLVDATVQLNKTEGMHIKFNLKKNCIYWPIIEFKTDGNLTTLQWCVEVLASDLREVKFAIISTTFKKERDIKATISNLDSFFLKASEKPRFFVIDNGQTLNKDDFPPTVNLIAQENLGGAGGFTRGLKEASASGCSHFLFMDDDIIVEPELLARIIRLQRINSNDVMLAGAMLDSYSPTDHYECGAKVAYEGFSLVPQLHRISLCKPENFFRALQELENIDYGGWWCFSFSQTNYFHIGDPLQIFIRGDDEEFCLRGKTLGINTRPLAGVGVWHEPFYAKNISWIRYYLVRNRLLIANKYSSKPIGPYLIKLIAKDFLGAVLRYEYDAAYAIYRGLKDFLNINQLLAASPADTHADLMAKIKGFLPKLEICEHSPVQQIKPPKWQIRLRLLILNGHLLPIVKKTQIINLADFSWANIFSSKVKVVEGTPGKAKSYSLNPILGMYLMVLFCLTLARAAVRICVQSNTFARSFRYASK
ncbi:MAG: hypothetical protein RJB66_1684 [Pseudomonadota bacterium]|jgi:galactofuranosylgalactofuranosylrhamnosyl-N-acetylglucosaminyl-diphospho-decaprenol beta-1,5/1,6-galactofuranosyltransferase